jgi:hypothetical protein
VGTTQFWALPLTRAKRQAGGVTIYLLKLGVCFTVATWRAMSSGKVPTFTVVVDMLHC